jgi:hypothetical protein
MNATGLFCAPGTSEPMQKLAMGIPPFDLLNAYREAVIAFKTTDIVLILSHQEDDGVKGFSAMARSAYIKEAFRNWKPQQLIMHPLCRESAHKKTSLPSEMPAFWLVVQAQDKGAILCCAIGTHLQRAAAAAD